LNGVEGRGEGLTIDHRNGIPTYANFDLRVPGKYRFRYITNRKNGSSEQSVPSLSYAGSNNTLGFTTLAGSSARFGTRSCLEGIA
jgi:hypothetical protein